MSIALSLLLAPSRRLRLALAAFAALQLGAALLLAVQAGAAGAAAALACLLAGLLLGARALARPTMRRIDISGPGALRLTVQQNSGTAPAQAGAAQALMPASTLWPQLLMLLLRSEDGAVTALAVLPDSVAPGQFRALAVALRHVAGRDNKFFKINKIL